MKYNLIVASALWVQTTTVAFVPRVLPTNFLAVRSNNHLVDLNVAMDVNGASAVDSSSVISSSTSSGSTTTPKKETTVAAVPKVAQRWRKSTKQLVTLGPASSNREMIEKLFLAGADLFRLNFSHGSQEQKKELLMTIREIEEKYAHPIGILGDLQGPKLRVSFLFLNPSFSFSIPLFLLLCRLNVLLFFLLPCKVGEFSSPTGEMLQKGQTFRLDLDTAKGDNTRVMLPHPEIIEASEVGHTLMVDDGKVRLKVIAKGKDFLDCSVEVPGKISNRKGVNTPDSVR